jgi:hypothetical protein
VDVFDPNLPILIYPRHKKRPYGENIVQGGLDPSKISGLGVDFGHLVRCLLLGNKDAARKPSMIFS